MEPTTISLAEPGLALLRPSLVASEHMKPTQLAIVPPILATAMFTAPWGGLWRCPRLHGLPRLSRPRQCALHDLRPRSATSTGLHRTTVLPFGMVGGLA